MFHKRVLFIVLAVFIGNGHDVGGFKNEDTSKERGKAFLALRGYSDATSEYLTEGSEEYSVEDETSKSTLIFLCKRCLPSLCMMRFKEYLCFHVFIIGIFSTENFASFRISRIIK